VKRLVPILALLLCAGGCSKQVADPHLPEPLQADHAPAPIADGMVGLATFSGEVLVMSRRDYPVHREDPLSAVSPTDLAVAWGPSARSDVRAGLDVWQVNRRFAWRAGSKAWANPDVRSFMRHSGNWHMIPATPEVARELGRVRKGDIVRIEGDLVQVTFSNGVYFRSSMTRDDEGDGACEIIRATSIVVVRA